MKRVITTLGVIVFLLVIVLAAAGCGAEEEAATTTAPPATPTTAAPSTETTAPVGPATGDPIKIGFSNSLTGVAATPGVAVSKGVAVQVEYVNSMGGINGRPLEIIELDDASEIPNAVAILHRLIEDEGVVATIGPFAQFMQEAARGIAERTGTPMVGSGPATLEQIAGTKYTYSVLLSQAPPSQADALKKVIAANGWKNILAIGDALSIHLETLDMLVDYSAAGGYTFTTMPDIVQFGQTDFHPVLNRMMEKYRELGPDAVFLYVNMLAAPAMYQGLRALGVTVPILGSPACAHPAIFAMGPEAVEGFLVLDAGGSFNPAGLPADWPLRDVQLDFHARFEAMHNEPPDFFAAYGAGLVTVLTEALKASGAPDDKSKIAEALINLTDVKTVTGIVNLSPEDTNQGIKGQMVLWQVRDGEFELVKTVN